jgi:DNA-binding CsgD family transcriptional regulator
MAVGPVHVGASRPGLVVVDASFNPLASNAEAINILAYPQRAEQFRRLEDALASRIRAQLSHDVQGVGDFVAEFRSGKRLYLCRSFFLSDLESGKPTRVLVLERLRSNVTVLSDLAEKFGLTPREQNTIQLLLLGLTTKEIAREMKISPNTVKAFLRLVMVKMGVSTRSGIIGKIVAPKA